jgi:hypothetical protein
MRRRLNESMTDLELAVAKSLSRSPLSPAEVNELRDLSTNDLMSEFGLDYLMAGEVSNHVKHEMLRLQAQNQQTPLDDTDFSFTSLTRSNPISQKPLNLSEAKLRSLVRKMVNEEKYE